MGSHTTVELLPMLDDLDVGVTVHQPESGTILGVNDRLEQLSGYSTAELVEMSIETYSAHLSGVSTADVIRRIRAAAAGEDQQFQLQFERATGELRWVSVTLSRTTLDGESCVVGTVTDITAERSHRRRLRLLTRVVRHNLRNDMNVLIGHAEEVQETITAETAGDELETILEIATDVGNLSKAIQEIEEIATPTATERSPTNLSDVVHTVVEEYRAEYPDSELAVETAGDVWVTGDAGLYYAIDHAIENALEHNDQDTPRVTVTVDTDAADDCGVIRVADNGPPIEPTEIDVLDEATLTTDTYHGSGIGLWVMKWCVESLAGELSFAANSPRGNVVSLAIPLAPVDSRDP